MISQLQMKMFRPKAKAALVKTEAARKLGHHAVVGTTASESQERIVREENQVLQANALMFRYW
ncbi:hypothetical protein [Chitinimonas sp. BJB300]|uniref:hypothetical protein n=1 Tax=Chitinimonas sp. BJB300 TaxID=1559339 RepID=UPI000C0CA7AE|nr:hypothetical protein [Chitinimonas sp. BJB300]PHV13418.1 hypothetical protein CSQ89_00600 [Chitinimonas sp. BJB300]